MLRSRAVLVQIKEGVAKRPIPEFGRDNERSAAQGPTDKTPVQGRRIPGSTCIPRQAKPPLVDRLGLKKSLDLLAGQQMEAAKRPDPEESGRRLTLLSV